MGWALLWFELPSFSAVEVRNSPWRQVVLDGFGRGADGVRLVAGSASEIRGAPVPWEEAGVVRWCHLGRKRMSWDCQDLLELPGAEEAIGYWRSSGELVGLAGSDSALGTRARLIQFRARAVGVFAHWTVENAFVVADRADGAWLAAEPVVDSRGHWIGVLLGGRFLNFGLGWLRWTESFTDEDRRIHEVWHSAGWIMGLRVLYQKKSSWTLALSERSGPMAGVWLLQLSLNHSEVPVVTSATQIRSGRRVPMMFDVISKTSGTDLAVAESRGGIWVARLDLVRNRVVNELELPRPKGTGTPKAVRWADLDQDGLWDLVVSCEGASRGKVGVYWWRGLSEDGSRFAAQDISGPKGVKFDRLELLDLNQDGLDDVLTTEETRLGFVVYLNPNERASVRN